MNLDEEFVDSILIENQIEEISEVGYRVLISYAKTLDEATKKKIKEESGSVPVNTTAGAATDTPVIKRKMSKQIVEKENKKTGKKSKYIIFHASIGKPEQSNGKKK